LVTLEQTVPLIVAHMERVLAEHPAPVTYSPAQLLDLLRRRPPPALMDALWRYVEVIGSPESRRAFVDELNRTIERKVGSAEQLLWHARFTVADPTLTEQSACERLAVAHVVLTATSDAGQIWGVYRKWVWQDGEIALRGVALLKQIFPQARLASKDERDFFRETLVRLAQADAEEIVDEACRAVARASVSKDDAAEKVAFLAGTVWPDRRADIAKRVPQQVIDTFSEVRAVLLPSN
jgi:hypothetical protein